MRTILKLLVWGVMFFFFASTTAAAQSGTNAQDDGVGSPQFTTAGSTLIIPPTTKTVPHWTSSFTYKGVTFPFTMVGTNPASGSSTTTVPVAIIPFEFVFADGQSLDGGRADLIANVLASPNFQNFAYTSGTTQFADAVQRAEFWPAVSTTSANWHVLLGAPTVYPTQVISVPRNQAVDFVGRNSG